MKYEKKLKIWLIIATLLHIIAGLICSVSVGISIVYLINKWFKLGDITFILWLIVISFVLFVLYFTFLIYPFIVKKDNKFTKKFNKHSISISFFVMMIMIIIVSINNIKEYDLERLSNLLNIEWIIFGITVAFFTIWNTFFITKYEKKEENPNEIIGLKRLELIIDINDKKMHFKIMIYSLIMIIINVILLLTFTSMFLVNEIDKNVVNVISLISFYFCTNTMITIFIECIFPMIEMKMEFDGRIEKYDLKNDLKNDLNLIVTSAFEEVAYNLMEKNTTDLDENKATEVLDKFKEILIKNRNDDGKAKTKVKNKDDSNTKISEDKDNESEKLEEDN